MNVFTTDLRVQVDQHENDQQRERNDDLEPLLGALEIFELPGPLDVIAGRKFHALADALRGGVDVAVDVVAGDVHENEADELAVFVADGGRAGFVADVGEHRDGTCGDRGASAPIAPSHSLSPLIGQRHEHALERIEVFAEIARVTDADRITLAAFDGGGDGLAADGGFDDVVHVADASGRSARRLRGST